jgi:hypothetical protein
VRQANEYQRDSGKDGRILAARLRQYDTRVSGETLILIFKYQPALWDIKISQVRERAFRQDTLSCAQTNIMNPDATELAAGLCGFRPRVNHRIIVLNFRRTVRPAWWVS